MHEAGQKTIRVLQFNYPETPWKKWSHKFLAQGAVLGYKNLLCGVDDPSLTDEERADLNKKAYNNLILACVDDVSFNIIDTSTSTKYPRGDERLGWTRLQKKFEPDDGQSIIKLKREFNNKKLDNFDDDPDDWINELISMQSKLSGMGVAISDDDLLLHILCILPEEYDNTIEIAEKDMASGSLTVEDLKVRLNARYKRRREDEIKSEIGLTSRQSTTTSECSHCGKRGHKSNDCFLLPKNMGKFNEWHKKKMSSLKSSSENGSKKQGPLCWKCGKHGHKRQQCPEASKKVEEDLE